MKSSKNSKEKKTDEVVLNMMEQLAKLLIDYRIRENIDQKTMSELLGISISRYNEIEKLRNLNPEFGVSLAFLNRFAELEKTPLSKIVETIQGKNKMATSQKNQIEETLLESFGKVKLSLRKAFFESSQIDSSSNAMEDRFKWWVELGLDLFSLSLQNQLNFELQIHQILLKEKDRGSLSIEMRRERLAKVMQELLEIT